MSSKKLTAGIVGATGYTGLELLRLLADHSHVDNYVITSNTEEGRSVRDVFPGLPGHLSVEFFNHDCPELCECDVVFFATPSATAMDQVPKLLDNNVRVIDLSADFRLRDSEQWQHWYGVKHAAPELLATAVYGLPELNRQHIAKAQLVANPGCYPTAILLGFLPVLAENCVDLNSLLADAKSGVSGAGRKMVAGNMFSEVSETFRAYGVSDHRHLPEICQVLGDHVGQPIVLTFVPHLVPMIRGLFATLYARMNKTGIDVTDMYARFYKDEPFVDVLPAGSQPDTGSVRGTNMCRLAVHQLADSNKLIVLSVIDNLVKGAAGQAVQNMNIMFGLDEDSGLGLSVLYP